MRKLRILCLICVASYACCKDIDPGQDTLFGKWEILFMDSCQIPGKGEKPFIHLEKLPYSGYLQFNQDSSGILKVDGGFITLESDSCFSWFHDTSSAIIDFSFTSGTTAGIIVNQSIDNLEIYIRDYHFPPPPFPIIKPYYYLNLKRQ